LSSIFQKISSSSIGKIFESSSIFQNIEEVFHFLKIEVVFHFPKIEVVFHLQKHFRLSSNLGLTPPLHGYFVKFWSVPAISLLVRPGGRAARRMLDIAKLKLNSASLVELGLGLSLATI
jgi:hypothetical protein